MALRLGLVKYKGRKLAPFEVVRAGTARLWSADRTPTEHVKSARWLKEEEAKEYDILAEFTVTRWGRDVRTQLPVKPGQKRKRPRRARRSDIPDPRAIPLQVLMEAQEATDRAEEQRARERREAAELDEALERETETVVEEVQMRFVLSASGILHTRECSSCPKKPIGSFLTLDEGALAPRFKKFHRCIK